MRIANIVKAISLLSVALLMVACFGGKVTSSSGGEVTGAGGRAFTEPTPYGMTLVKRGHLRMGMEKQDSLWGKQTPVKDISVEGFWMDETEITNSQYRQFVNYVRDSIIRERLADPAYGGDETYKIEEDKNGDPVTPHLNWKKALPRKPNEDELRAIESVYTRNPITGEKMLDYRQMNYRYEVYDYKAAALRRNRLNPEERNLNTGEGQTGEGGDLIFARKFKNFILELEWKVSKGGNSGIFYLAQEVKTVREDGSEKYEPIYISSPEYQVLDNANHPDAFLGVDGNRQSASLYDMIPAKPQNSNAFGEWNKAKISL